MQQPSSGGSAVAAPPALKTQLLTLDQVEERIVDLLSVCASVCSAVSDVHPDSLDKVAASSRAFHASLRLIYASLVAHIRAHAGEVHMHGAGTPAAGSAGGAAAGGAGAGAAAAAAREYRRNVYLDTQHMAVLMESMHTVKQRIEEAQAKQAEWQQQTQQQQTQIPQQPST